LTLGSSVVHHSVGLGRSHYLRHVFHVLVVLKRSMQVLPIWSNHNISVRVILLHLRRLFFITLRNRSIFVVVLSYSTSALILLNDVWKYRSARVRIDWTWIWIHCWRSIIFCKLWPQIRVWSTVVRHRNLWASPVLHLEILSCISIGTRICVGLSRFIGLPSIHDIIWNLLNLYLSLLFPLMQ
jgi:hypothetical protein